MSTFDLVIVGGGLASARAIKSYREAGGEGTIALLSQDAALPYHRPPLSKRYLRGELDDAPLVEDELFYRDQAVEVLLETTVTGVDPRERTVSAGGSGYRYERLLLATGARPRRLGVPGADLDGVFTLRSLADSQAIREAARVGRDALVVGGGFIGMEVAASLRHLRREVTLVHRDPGLFQLLGAPELERDLGSLFAKNGVKVILPDEAAAFYGRSQVDSVETKTHKLLTTDFVVVGIGVEPVVDFLVGSGVELDNGVLVNERFESNVPGVYAVGDVANFYDPLYARQRRIEHWSNANYQGGVVGKVLAGRHVAYETVSTFFTELFGVTIKVFGDHTRYDELVVRGSLAERDLLGFYLEGGRLVATMVVGQDEETEGELKKLIERRAVLDAALLADPSAAIDRRSPSEQRGKRTVECRPARSERSSCL